MTLCADTPVGQTSEGKKVCLSFSSIHINSWLYDNDDLDEIPFTNTIRNEFPNFSDEA